MLERLKGMMTGQRAIIALTAFLVLVGAGALWTSFYSGSDSYDTATTYEAARSGGDLPQSAPTLPKCASGIKMGKSETTVTTISFDCNNETELAAFVALVRSGFSWNIFVEGGHVTLEAVKTEE